MEFSFSARPSSGIFMALPTFYTPSEVAGKLKVSRRSVYQWLMSGRLSGLKAGQGWRITEEALIAFMERSDDWRGPSPGRLAGKSEK